MKYIKLMHLLISGVNDCQCFLFLRKHGEKKNVLESIAEIKN